MTPLILLRRHKTTDIRNYCPKENMLRRFTQHGLQAKFVGARKKIFIMVKRFLGIFKSVSGVSNFNSKLLK